MTEQSLLPDTRRLRSEGLGYRRIGRELGISKDAAGRLVKKIELEDARTGIAINGNNAVTLYDAACQALAKARTLIEVKDIADRAAALKEYGRLAKDRMLEIDAAELRIRAERRLGEMLAASPKNAGARGIGKSGVLLENSTLDEMGIDKKLSSRAQQLAKIATPVMESRIAQWREAAAHDTRVSVNILKGGPINGHRATAPGRVEPDDSLDPFPTPPWATRVLCEIVLPHVGFILPAERIVWEPACGEGHIAEVLKEYFYHVHSSDIFDYGYGESPIDFLAPANHLSRVDWIITNPPFSGATDRALEFTLRALDLAREGVAMFVRSQWAVEGCERYEKLFRDRLPTLMAFFSERVNLCRGRWDPNGTTATAYCWLVWMKGREPMPPFWIPPGQRKALSRPDDRARFAEWSLPPDHIPYSAGKIVEAPE